MSTSLKNKLIKKATKKYHHIYPVLNRKLNDCFTQFNGDLIFWFNTKDKSTHVEKIKVSKRDANL